MSVQRRPIPHIEGFHCFGCGTENPRGLHLQFYEEAGEVRADVTLPAHLVGWENIAHGGIVSLLLDEVMAWTVLRFRRAFCVTREIRVRFVAPVEVGRPLTVCGAVAEKDPPRAYACKVRGRIISVGEGGEPTVLARAEADFALLRGEQVELLPRHVREGMSEFLASLERWDRGEG